MVKLSTPVRGGLVSGVGGLVSRVTETRGFAEIVPGDLVSKLIVRISNSFLIAHLTKPPRDAGDGIGAVSAGIQ